jgi:endo-1,4-beta-xylanase
MTGQGNSVMQHGWTLGRRAMKLGMAPVMAVGLVACAGPASAPATTAAAAPGTQRCSNSTGEHGGYYYTFWYDRGQTCITLGDAGAYALDWDLVATRGNMVSGKGWRTGILERVVHYNAASFDAGSNGYLTLYGWSRNPLVEYYVVDSWGRDFTPPGANAEVLGTVESDGGTYRIYRTLRVRQPSIEGTQTFAQFWSVRTQRRPVGVDSTITFANHVAAWRAAGLELGRMDYQVMATEGFGSRGSSHVRVWGE